MTVSHTDYYVNFLSRKNFLKKYPSVIVGLWEKSLISGAFLVELSVENAIK